MATIHNEIIINAPAGKIWDALSNMEKLDQYDPTVKKSTVLTEAKSGIGARRKVEMLDGKNWFDETCTVFKPNEALAYELHACSLPVRNLKHSYSFESIGEQIKVKQVMQYNVKFGILGRLLDVLVMRKQSDAGIKKFFMGLKTYAENQN
jgi:ribosome-associated toxin RatA of RatAB toxin-antitoxin module